MASDPAARAKADVEWLGGRGVIRAMLHADRTKLADFLAHRYAEIAEAAQAAKGVQCPFCAEDDFDLVGLKLHLCGGGCEAYEKQVVA